jgi:hypothetical protein
LLQEFLDKAEITSADFISVALTHNLMPLCGMLDLDHSPSILVDPERLPDDSL